jgi:hypothetical protein
LTADAYFLEMHAVPTMSFAKRYAFQAIIVARINVC